MTVPQITVHKDKVPIPKPAKKKPKMVFPFDQMEIENYFDWEVPEEKTMQRAKAMVYSALKTYITANPQRYFITIRTIEERKIRVWRISAEDKAIRVNKKRK